MFKKFKKGKRSEFVKNYVKGRRILDLGCAGSNGFMHKVILKNNKSSEIIVGLDLNLENLKKINRLNDKLILANAQHLPFKDSTFDCVYMGELIEHFWSAEELLNEVEGVLNSRGVICLDTPNVYNLNRILKFILRGKDTLGDLDHKMFYTPDSLSRLLNHLGFKILKITSDAKIGFFRKVIILNFPPFTWLGSHLCLVAKKGRVYENINDHTKGDKENII